MPRPATSRVPASRVLLVASSGAFLAFLDATIVNVAFPSIRASFPGTSISDLTWVLNAYNIVFAAFLVVFGRLSDLLGRRRAFVSGVAMFTIASLLCGIAPTVGLLVAARVLQALGAAMLVPASLAVVVEAFPEERRAHAISLWGATAAVAAGLGPPIGGALVQVGGWRWAFLVNVPLGAVAVVAARRNLVESRSPGRRRLPDLRGAVLLAAALGALNLGIVKGSDWGWSNPFTVGALVASVVLTAAFVRSSRRHPSPLLDPALLRIPSFSIANLATVLAGLGFFAYLLTNVLWLQYVWHYSVLRSGLALMPGALVAAVVASVLGPVAAKRGYRLVVVPGALVWAGAYLWYHQQTGLSPAFLTEWLPGQVLSGIGVGATLPVLGSAALAAIPGGRFATASAVVSSTRQIGGVLGIAILVVIVGTPNQATIVGALRDGWVLSIIAFLLVAVVAVPLGRVQPYVEAPEELDDTAQVHRPPPVVTAAANAGITVVPLFAGLPAAARRRLAKAARPVQLAAGEVLMEEGAAGSSAYVVKSGRLQVLIGGQVVRELSAGDVLGELAVLTGERRSATVRARRDATLLEVMAEDFSALLDEPATAHVVAAQLAARSRGPAPTAGRRPPRPAVVAVVGLHRGAAYDHVADALEQRLQVHHRIAHLRDGRAEAVEQAEQDGALVLLSAAAGRTAWREFCLRQADCVVLVAAAGEAAAAVDAGAFGTAQPELVLVGPRPAPAALSAWAERVDARGITVADDVLPAALRPLADRIAGRSVGLVLGGGGARALAHIGVLRELEEAGIVVDRIAGCSLGAVVAGVHATGRSGAELEDLCYLELVRRRPFNDYTAPTVSLAGGRRLERALHRAFGDLVVEGLPRSFSCVSTDLAARSRHVHRRGLLLTAVRASVGLPVLFPPVPDGQRLLVDGGVLDNLPVDLLTERDEGPVVAINIPMGSGSRAPAPGTPRRPARVPPLGETLLRTMMISSGGAVAAAQAKGAFVVTPATMGVGLLEFHQMDRMIAAGRAAARALLEQTGGNLSTQVVVPAPRQADAPRPRRRAAARV